MVAHRGFEPLISALRGRCPGPLDECATPTAEVQAHDVSSTKNIAELVYIVNHLAGLQQGLSVLLPGLPQGQPLPNRNPGRRGNPCGCPLHPANSVENRKTLRFKQGLLFSSAFRCHSERSEESKIFQPEPLPAPGKWSVKRVRVLHRSTPQNAHQNTP